MPGHCFDGHPHFGTKLTIAPNRPQHPTDLSTHQTSAPNRPQHTTDLSTQQTSAPNRPQHPTDLSTQQTSAPNRPQHPTDLSTAYKLQIWNEIYENLNLIRICSRCITHLQFHGILLELELFPHVFLHHRPHLVSHEVSHLHNRQYQTSATGS